MSDSPVLIPQSFFPHTISTIMVVDDNTRHKNKDQIKNRFKTMNELAQLMLEPLLRKKCILYIESSVLFCSC